MRRFDKKDNIRKANLLSEQRYLESKGLINENSIESKFNSSNFSDAIVKGAQDSLHEDEENDKKEKEQMINVILGYGGQRQSLENLDRETLLKMLYNIGFDKRDDNPRARAMAKDLYNLLKPKKKGFLGLFEVDGGTQDSLHEDKEFLRMKQLAGLIKEDTASDINKLFDKNLWGGAAQQGTILKLIQYLIQGRESEALNFSGNNIKLMDELKKYLAQIPKDKIEALKVKSGEEIQKIFQNSIESLIDYLGKSGVLK